MKSIHLRTLYSIAATILMIVPFISRETLAWSSVNDTPGKHTNTHQFIMDNGLNLLKERVGNEIQPIELDLIRMWKKQLEKGMVCADWKCKCNSLFTYGSHYYNPHTKKSFIPTKTAKDLGAKYFKKAGHYYQKGQPEKAFYHLGLSLHYITDLTQPMHASLYTDFKLSMPGYHYVFERVACTVESQFIADKCTKLLRLEDGMTPEAFIHEVALQSYAEYASIKNKKIKKWYWESLFSKKSSQKWKNEVIPTIGKQLIEAQKLVAQFIHLWFQMYVLPDLASCNH